MRSGTDSCLVCLRVFGPCSTSNTQRSRISNYTFSEYIQAANLTNYDYIQHYREPNDIILAVVHTLAAVRL